MVSAGLEKASARRVDGSLAAIVSEMCVKGSEMWVGDI